MPFTIFSSFVWFKTSITRQALSIAYVPYSHWHTRKGRGVIISAWPCFVSDWIPPVTRDGKSLMLFYLLPFGFLASLSLSSHYPLFLFTFFL